MSPTSSSPAARPSFVDRSIVLVLFAIWVVSVARIALEVMRHQPFGVEATIAVAMAFVLPFVLRSARR